MSTDLYLSDVELLCTTCKQPIKARINTPQWIRVEWISPQGECQACHSESKQQSTKETDSNEQT
jgi:hypothetical protein